MIRFLKLTDYEEARRLVSQVHELHRKSRPDIYKDGNPLPIEYFKMMINDGKFLNIAYEENNQLVGLLMATKKTSSPIPITRERTTY